METNKKRVSMQQYGQWQGYGTCSSYLVFWETKDIQEELTEKALVRVLMNQPGTCGYYHSTKKPKQASSNINNSLIFCFVVWTKVLLLFLAFVDLSFTLYCTVLMWRANPFWVVDKKGSKIFWITNTININCWKSVAGACWHFYI